MKDRAWLSSIVALACAASACGQRANAPSRGRSFDEVPRRYVVEQARGQIRIDGRVEKDEWAASAWSEAFVDIRGAGRPSPPLRTRMRMLYDDACLYVAADLGEPHIRATLTQRDSIVFHDNDFEVFLDPGCDRRNYFEIEVNALNTVFDLLLVRPYRAGGPALHGWDAAGLRTAVAIDGSLNDPANADRGWSVEMAVPWSALVEHAGVPLPPRAGDVWRVNFSRVEWPHEVFNGAYRNVPGAKEDNWVWSPQGIVDMHRPERWGLLQFAPHTSASQR